MTQLPTMGRAGRMLVTYGWVRSSYAALRDLARHGIHVFSADTHRIGMCSWSRHSRGHFLYPSPLDCPASFAQRIGDLCLELDCGLILPSHDETEVLACHRHLLPPGTDALIPDADCCRIFNDKTRTHDLAEGLGLPTPPRVAYKDPSELRSVFHALNRGSGVVIKLRRGNGAKGVFYASSADETRSMVEALIDRHQLGADRLPQIETRVTGFGAGCSVLYWRGRHIAHFGHRRERERIRTGGTSTLRSVLDHPGIIAAARTLFDSVQWHGLAMSEFKIDPQTGEFWLIEVNPRLWGSLPFAIAAGMPFPYLLWLCATHGVDAAEAILNEARVRPGARGRWLLGDLIGACSHFTNLRWREAMQCLRPGQGASLDDFAWDDPGAFLGECANYLCKFLAHRSLNPTEKGSIG